MRMAILSSPKASRASAAVGKIRPASVLEDNGGLQDRVREELAEALVVVGHDLLADIGSLSCVLRLACVVGRVVSN